MGVNLVKYIQELAPQKLLVLLLVLAVIALFGWIQVLTGANTSDRKEALAKCIEGQDRLLKRIDALEFRCDSIIRQQGYDKENTITLLQQMLDKNRLINNKIKRQK